MNSAAEDQIPLSVDTAENYIRVRERIRIVVADSIVGVQTLRRLMVDLATPASG